MPAGSVVAWRAPMGVGPLARGSSRAVAVLRRLMGGLLLAAAVWPAGAWAEQLIAYEPAVTTLTGTLAGGWFAHPNGQRVRFWFVKLREPVGVRADPANPVNGDANGVREIQLYSADAALRRQLDRRLGQRVALAGAVFHGHTAWHVRTLVMAVSSVRRSG